MLTGLRGYDEAYERLKPSSPAGRASRHVRTVSKALCFTACRGHRMHAADCRSRSMSRQVVPAEAGVREIHRAIARHPGRERAGTPREYRHRVSSRLPRRASGARARCFGQLKHVFPSDSVEHFSTEFSWLGRLTGPPRDLDVLVLSLQGITRRTCRRGTWTCSWRFWARLRQHERQTLVEALDSPRYQAATRRPGSGFLAQPAPFASTAPECQTSACRGSGAAARGG